MRTRRPARAAQRARTVPLLCSALPLCVASLTPYPHNPRLFSNEAGCGDGSLLNNDTVVRAKQAAYDNDGSRLVGANMGWLSPVTPRTPMSDALDIMGMSHASSESVSVFHEREPSRPLMMSECCSCETQRGEDEDMPRNKSTVYYSNLNGGCLNNQVSTSDLPEYVAATFVWTLHDYVVRTGLWGASRIVGHFSRRSVL